MRRLDQVLVAAVLVAVFAYAGAETLNLSQRARLFPLATLAPALALGAFQLARELRRAREASDPVPPEARFTPSAAAWFAAFFGLVWLVGLLAAVPAFTLAYLRAAAREPWPLALGYALGAWAFLYFVFVNLLHIRMPGGIVQLTS